MSLLSFLYDLFTSRTFWTVITIFGVYVNRLLAILAQQADDVELLILCKDEKFGRLIRDKCQTARLRLDRNTPFVDAFTTLVNDFMHAVYLIVQAVIDWLVSHWYLWAIIALVTIYLAYRFIVAMEKGIKKGNPNKAARMLMNFRNLFMKDEPHYKPPPPAAPEIPVYQRPAVVPKSLPMEQHRFIGYSFQNQE